MVVDVDVKYKWISSSASIDGIADLQILFKLRSLRRSAVEGATPHSRDMFLWKR
jgi:hypothetical protein